MIGSSLQYFQQGATVDGSGTNLVEDGYGACFVEIVESGGGTATVTFNGSFSGVDWYAVGYEKVSATATPARAVTGISVTANSKAVYQILDRYPQLQAVISSSSGSTVSVRAYFVP